MSAKIVRLSIFTSVERNAALLSVREAIMSAGGWIADQTLFSNVACTINFEIPPTSLPKLQTSLLDAGMKLHVDTQPPKQSPQDLKASLAITFSHHEPDLKRTVPPFG